MAKQLQYYPHDNRARLANGREVFTRANEVHELAADIQHIGAVALFSEVQASHLVGPPADVTVPNPFGGFRERRPLSSLYGVGKEHHRLVKDTLALANNALNDLASDLHSGAERVPLDENPVAAGLAVLRGHGGPGAQPNCEMIFEGADMPAFFTIAKDLTAERVAADAQSYGWEQWFAEASDEQLTNFAQWYTQRLKTLADSETRGEFVGELKETYKSRVRRAIDDGWIDDRHAVALERRISAIDVRFFSPFGQMPAEIGGLLQDRRPAKLALLPSLTGDEIVTHEFSHAFGGIDYAGMARHLSSFLGAEQTSGEAASLEHLSRILDEGFNEHLTAALLKGAPETISPVARQQHANLEVSGASEGYQDYREFVGALLGGIDRRITEADIRQVVDAMVDGDTTKFVRIVAVKWGQRDPLGEMFKIVQQHDHERQNGATTYDQSYTEKALTQKLIEQLNSLRS